jgi:hypothetical protein
MGGAANQAPLRLSRIACPIPDITRSGGCCIPMPRSSRSQRTGLGRLPTSGKRPGRRSGVPCPVQQLAREAPSSGHALLVESEVVARLARALGLRARRPRRRRWLAVNPRAIPGLEAHRHPVRRQSVAWPCQPVGAARRRRCLHRAGVQPRAARVIRAAVSEARPVGAAPASAGDVKVSH